MIMISIFVSQITYAVLISIQEAAKKLATGTAISIQHPALTGGIRYQQPLEIGTPTSIFANVAIITALVTNMTRTSGPGGAQTEEDTVSQ